MPASLILSPPILLLVSSTWLLLLGGAAVTALRHRARATRHIRAGRADMHTARGQIETARKRSRAAAEQAGRIQRGAETDAERLERLRTEVEVRSRGQWPRGGVERGAT